MEKGNLEAHLQDILKKVEKVVEENDEETIWELTSYIHVSKDLIRFYQSKKAGSEEAKKAYELITEAEEKVSKISRTNHIRPSLFDLRGIVKTFIASLKEISRA